MAPAKKSASKPAKKTAAKKTTAKKTAAKSTASREGSGGKTNLGANTPGVGISTVNAAGDPTGTGPKGAILPVDKSGLHSVTHDELNPAFAIDTTK